MKNVLNAVTAILVILFLGWQLCGQCCKTECEETKCSGEGTEEVTGETCEKVKIVIQTEDENGDSILTAVLEDVNLEGNIDTLIEIDINLEEDTEEEEIEVTEK